MTTSLRRLFRNSGILLLGAGLNAGISLVQSVLVAGILGPEGLGVVAGALALPTLCAGLLGFRTSEALSSLYTSRAAEGDSAACGRLLAGSLAADLVSALVTFACCALLYATSVFPKGLAGEGEFLTLLYCGVFLFLPFITLGTAILRESNRYKWLSIVPVLASLAQLMWVAFYAHFGTLTPLFVVLSYFVAQGCQALIFIVLGLRLVKFRVGVSAQDVISHLLRGSFFKERAFISVLRASYFSGSLTAIIKNGDLVLLGAISGSAEVGCYRIAKQLVGLLQTAGASLSGVVFQDFNHHWARGESAEKMLWHVRRMMRFWGPLVAGGVIAAWYAIPGVIDILYGGAFAPAVSHFRILIFGIGVVTAFFWSQPLALSLGGWGLQSRVSLVAVAVFLVIGVGLAESLGARGVVIGVSASWATGTLLFVIFGLTKLRRLSKVATSQR